MSTYVGGLRARLIRDSVYRHIYDGLDALGWFTPRQSRSPLTFTLEPVDTNQVVAPNTLGMSDEEAPSSGIELGSNLSETAWAMFVDFFGENDPLSMHVIGDVAAILEGRMPSIGCGRPVIDVFDYTLATPARIFSVEIDEVQRDKAHDFPKPWLRFWRSCSFVALDTHGDEDDA